MPPPTLLCVSNFPSSTGYAWTLIGGLFARVADALAPLGVRTLVAFPTLDGPAPGLSGSAAESVAWDVALGRPRRAGGHGAALASTLRRLKAEDVRATWLVDRPAVHPTYALAHVAGVRRLLVHDHASGALPAAVGARGLAKRLAARTPGLAADVVVAVSAYVAARQRASGGVPASRLRVVPNPVSAAERRLGADALAAAVGARPGRRWVAAAGRLTEEKGFADLLDAADALPDDVELVVFGDGPARPALEARRARLASAARVHLPGARPGAADLVAAADVCVVPSRWDEAFCLAAAEPLARGRPLVATRVGAIPELVRDGETGVLVPPARPDALARAIRRLLDDGALAARLGEAGRRDVLARHAWPAVTAALCELLLPAFAPRNGTAAVGDPARAAHTAPER